MALPGNFSDFDVRPAGSRLVITKCDLELLQSGERCELFYSINTAARNSMARFEKTYGRICGCPEL